MQKQKQSKNGIKTPQPASTLPQLKTHSLNLPIRLVRAARGMPAHIPERDRLARLMPARRGRTAAEIRAGANTTNTFIRVGRLLGLGASLAVRRAIAAAGDAAGAEEPEGEGAEGEGDGEPGDGEEGAAEGGADLDGLEGRVDGADERGGEDCGDERGGEGDDEGGLKSSISLWCSVYIIEKVGSQRDDSQSQRW